MNSCVEKIVKESLERNFSRSRDRELEARRQQIKTEILQKEIDEQINKLKAYFYDENELISHLIH